MELPNGHAAKWLYSPQPVIWRVLPVKGPAAGGSLMLLTGKHISPAPHDHIFVRFDNVIVRGTKLPNGVVQCRTPTLRLGYVAVSISTNNGVDYSDAIPFEAMAAAGSLLPAGG